jgi:cation:H+ antiporter
VLDERRWWRHRVGPDHAGGAALVSWVPWLVVALGGAGLIVWGAETFAEHLAAASVRLGVSAFALALLLAGAEPEELATAVTAALRGSPGIAFGDVIGANVAACLLAVGVGAWIAPLPFGAGVRRYALAGLPLGGLAAWFAWDGVVGRAEGLVLVAGYVAFVAAIWAVERRPPAIGEVGELAEAREAQAGAPTSAGSGPGSPDPVPPPSTGGSRTGSPDPVPPPSTGGLDTPGAGPRVGRDLVLVLVGLVALALGAMALVEGVRRISGVEETQTALGLTVVGFATAFELVVLAWSSARRGVPEAVVAAVLGSFAYNVTMTLGAGALARPLRLADAGSLHIGWVVMLAALLAVLAAGARGSIARPAAVALLAGYPVFVAVAVLA